MKLSRRALILLFAWLAVAIGDLLLRLNTYLSAGVETQTSWLASLWFVMSIIIVALFIFELMSLRKIKDIKIQRKIPQTLAVNHYTQVELEVTNPSDQSFICDVFDHHPEFCISKGLPIKIQLNNNQKIKLNYEIKAFERGELIFKHCEIWSRSILGLLRRRAIINCSSVSKIYPNYRSIHNYILLATEQRTRQLGIRQRQKRGAGLDFLQLREYRQGDSFRQIDWRATSRLRKIISKEYQQERDQNIIFLLDSGRRMRTKDSELSHFDQALNATLLLASIALRQGDAVGFKVFGAKDFFIPPKKGASVINEILNQVYDLHPEACASDLIGAAESLNKTFVKRSLVVIVSNVRSEDEIEIKTAVSLLKKRHLVMLANLKEQVLEDVLEEPIHQLEDALKFSQTLVYLKERETLQKKLIHGGVIAVDSLPKNLAINMVNQYFDIKQSGRL